MWKGRVNIVGSAFFTHFYRKLMIFASLQKLTVVGVIRIRLPTMMLSQVEKCCKDANLSGRGGRE
jgi:hypothetical protein